MFEEMFWFLSSTTFWLVIIVFAMFLTAILTSSFSDDKTKGL
ncbi:hypothetical protein [Chengkuizengella axinellae]|uniref:Uncharacterized protein n=1 Tax=Chengkuizengella axinellae TaxID=3064388 RepID=A0ABT9J0M3_9BACL|nr:hypothetical protein [Chengkuizengella sp. 2205SS18-9]MDP5275166.1 hypothetical protein [Chengkuizengella sp. 2205SS18-9]